MRTPATMRRSTPRGGEVELGTNAGDEILVGTRRGASYEELCARKFGPRFASGPAWIAPNRGAEAPPCECEQPLTEQAATQSARAHSFVGGASRIARKRIPR